MNGYLKEQTQKFTSELLAKKSFIRRQINLESSRRFCSSITDIESKVNLLLISMEIYPIARGEVTRSDFIQQEYSYPIRFLHYSTMRHVQDPTLLLSLAKRYVFLPRESKAVFRGLCFIPKLTAVFEQRTSPISACKSAVPTCLPFNH